MKVKRASVPTNGNVERVFGAVKQGVFDPEEIAQHIGMDRQAVVNALARLVDSKRVRKDGPRRYVVNVAPVLSDVWR